MTEHITEGFDTTESRLEPHPEDIVTLGRLTSEGTVRVELDDSNSPENIERGLPKKIILGYN